MNTCSLRKTVVSKLGGSVLVNADSCGQAALFIVRRLHRCAEERFVVVVSARKGMTDELEQLARGIYQLPEPAHVGPTLGNGRTTIRHAAHVAS
jgi:aspartokinase